MPEPKDYARRLVKGSAIVFTAFIASALIGLLLRMFLARSLTVAEYGLFYAIFAFISLFILFRDLGLGAALVKYIPEFSIRKQFSKIKSSIAFALLIRSAFGLVVSAVLFVLSDYLSLSLFGTLDASLPLRILSVWFFVAIFYTLAQATFQGFQNMPAYVSVNLVNILLILVLAVVLVGFLGLGVSGVAAAYLIAAGLVGIFSLTFFVKRYPQVSRGKISITKPLVKKLSIFALPVLVGSIGSLIISYTDTIMITVFRTLPEVGFYQAAQPTAYMLWYFPLALTVVLFPMISEIWAKRKQKLLGDMLHFLTKFSLIVIMPLAFIFIAFPEMVINLLFGSGYLAGAAVLQILAAAAIIVTVYVILVHVMIGIGKPVILMKVVVLMACLNLAGNFALIPHYGIEGAAVATFVSRLFGLALAFYFIRKFIRFSVPFSSLFKTVIGGVLTLLLIFGLKSILVLSPWLEAFAVMIPGLVFYGAWILATKAITKDDLKLIREIVPIPKWLGRVAEKFVGK